MTGGLHRRLPIERVIHGQPFKAVLPTELERTGATRIFIITTARQSATPEMAALLDCLGRRHAGTFAGVASHVPRPCVLAGIVAARASGPDLLLAFGGGSVIDAAKVILLGLRQAVSTDSDLRALAGLARVDVTVWGDISGLRMIVLPTTLSAAELSWFGGSTDPAGRVKQGFGAPVLTPRTIIYDPALTLGVPLKVFLASGIKAIDHAAERLDARSGQPYSDALSAKALTLLSGALPRVLADPSDLAARGACQLGAWLSMAGADDGVGVGASHAIGHALGAHSGVGHGDTSCVSLAPVLRWNAAADAGRQQAIATALGQPDLTAGDAVGALVASLGLPMRLRNIGIDPADLRVIAAKAFADPPMRTNPRTPTGADEIEHLLRAMW